MSKVCIVIDTPPTPDPEVIEMALALATFDQEVTLIFTGAAIGWLIKQQGPRKVSAKTPSSLIKALPMYDCDQVFYQQEDAEQYGLSDELLFPFAQAATDADISTCIKQAHHCLRF